MTTPRKLTLAYALSLSSTQVDGWQTTTGPQTKVRLFDNVKCGDKHSIASNLVLVSRCNELPPGVQGFEILEKGEGCSIRYYDYPGCVAGNGQHFGISNVCNPNEGSDIRSIGLRGCKYGAGSSSLAALPSSPAETRSAAGSASVIASSAAAASSSAYPDSSYTGGGGGGGGMSCCGIFGLVFGIAVGVVTIVAGCCTIGQCL